MSNELTPENTRSELRRLSEEAIIESIVERLEARAKSLRGRAYSTDPTMLQTHRDKLMHQWAILIEVAEEIRDDVHVERE